MPRLFRLLLVAAAVVWLPSNTIAQSQSATESGAPTLGGDDVELPGVPRKPPQRPSQRPSADPCAASISEDNGIVTLSSKDAEQANKRALITLDDRSYLVHFDETGSLRARLPMLHARADLIWPGAAGQTCHRSDIVFKNFRTIVVAALVWKGDFALGLHVVEPDGRLGGPTYYVSADRPNHDHRSARGELQTFGEPGADATQVQLYTLPIERNPGHGILYLNVAFASRGDPAQAPFCGDDPRAAASYQLIELNLGQSERHGGAFGPVACGTLWPARENYFQPWKLKL